MKERGNGIVMGKRVREGTTQSLRKTFFQQCFSPTVLLSIEFSHLKKYTLFEELNPEGCVLLQLMINSTL